MVEGDVGLLEGDLDLPVDAVGDGVGYCEVGREEQRGRKTGGISLPLGRHKTEEVAKRHVQNMTLVQCQNMLVQIATRSASFI